VSAMDVLIGTLGIFIILNFLNTRLAGQPTPPPAPTAESKPVQAPTPPPAARPWWRRMWSDQPAQPVPPNRTAGTPGQPGTPNPENSNQGTAEPQEERIPTPPQDPIAVDLMKQTKGSVVVLMQQADQSKAGVEFMLRQGSRTWKPGRASKYQDQVFSYDRRLNYFFQPSVQTGAYEVLVRVKRGSRSGGTQTFGLFGKIIPAGQRAKTYNFGNYSIGGSEKDWTSVGTVLVMNNTLQFKARMAPASTPTQAPAMREGENQPSPQADPQPQTPPVTMPDAEPTPAPKQKNRRSSKWG
jgi:hypothetical protein